MAKGHDALLIALGGKPKGGDEEASESSDEEDLEVTAARDALDAAKDDDPDAFLDAVKRIVRKCMTEYDEDEG